MTLPNKLSLLRIFLIPAILACLLYEKINPVNLWMIGVFRVVALVLVIIATITDYYDGKLARQYGLVTNLGKFLDPLADKLLVASIFISFVDLGLFPGWLVIIILFREFVVTGLRSIVATQGQVMSSERWGKHKTGWQLATIITAITFMAVRDFTRAAQVWERPLVRGWHADIFFERVLLALLLICVFFTLLSGVLYVWKYRHLLHEDAPQSSAKP